MDFLVKARRMSGALHEGARILDFLVSRVGRAKLVEAAARGTVPVAAISQDLIDIVGRDALSSTATRQFVGLTCRAVLQEEGFMVERTGVKVRRDPIFTAGATYTRAPTPEPQTSPLLARLLDVLTPTEARQAIAVLNARLRRLDAEED